MEEAERLSAEHELDTLCARLEDMMKQLSAVQADYRTLLLAQKARVVHDREVAAKEATVEMERCLAISQAANSQLDAARRGTDHEVITRCEALLSRAASDYTLAWRRMQDACHAFDLEVRRQGFADETAYRRAFRTLPEEKRLREAVIPFREEYERNLARASELEALLGDRR